MMIISGTTIPLLITYYIIFKLAVYTNNSWRSIQSSKIKFSEDKKQLVNKPHEKFELSFKILF